MEEERRKPRVRGTGGLVKKAGSRFWSALVFVNGKQVCRSLGVESKAEATRKLAELVSAAHRGEALPQDIARVGYEELREALIQDYVLSGHKSVYVDAAGNPRVTPLKHLEVFFAGYRVPAITTDAVNAFKLARKAAGEAPATTNRALSALRRMFTLARKSGKIQLQHVPYFELLPEAAPRRGFLEPEQFRAVRAQLPERYRALATVAYFSGMRAGELKRLKWEGVDLEGGSITLWQDETKSGMPRVVPLDTECLQMLAMLQRDGEYVFGGSVPCGRFDKAWRSACRRAGVAGTLFHDMRRSAVRNLRRSGVSQEVAMRISGHRTESVYRRYSIVSEQDLRQAVKLRERWEAARGAGDQPAPEAVNAGSGPSMRVQ